jgi:hypothetical protein
VCFVLFCFVWLSVESAEAMETQIAFWATVASAVVALAVRSIRLRLFCCLLLIDSLSLSPLSACLPALSRVCKSLDFDSFPIIVISDFEVCVQKRAQNGWLFRKSTT